MNVNVWIDGGCRRNGAEDAQCYASVRIIGRKDTLYRIDLANAHTNNQAEYGALLSALDLLAEAKRFPGLLITIYSDSRLMVDQVLGRARTKNMVLANLRAAACEGLISFAKAEVKIAIVPVSRDEMVKRLGH
jgi:ribonuclease HI